MRSRSRPLEGTAVRTTATRRIYVVLGLLAAGLLVGVSLASRHALPPRVIVMATGPEGGSYAAYGARYREFLAREGLELRLRSTAGDGENLGLLRDPGSEVSVTFLE